MTTMTVIDVCRYLYPGQLETGNIVFGMNSDGTFFITSWTVPDIDEPTIDYLQSQIPNWQHQFDFDYFNGQVMPIIRNYLSQIATERRYISEYDCVSYASSTYAQWQKEANTFIAWRDEVFLYTIEQIALMQSGSRGIPTFDEFLTELPTIVWP